MNHVVRVIQLSDADIDDLYRARCVLEAAGATALVADVTAGSVLARLEDLLASIEEGVASHDADADRRGSRTTTAASGTVEAPGRRPPRPVADQLERSVNSADTSGSARGWQIAAGVGFVA